MRGILRVCSVPPPCPHRVQQGTPACHPQGCPLGQDRPHLRSPQSAWECKHNFMPGGGGRSSTAEPVVHILLGKGWATLALRVPASAVVLVVSRQPMRAQYRRVVYYAIANSPEVLRRFSCQPQVVEFVSNKEAE